MTARTSMTHPLEVHWVPDLPTPGALGLTLAPGKHGSTFYGTTPWARDLDADLGRLRGYHRTDVLVSLMEDHEYAMLAVPDLLERARGVGLDVRHFPIRDVSVPRPEHAPAFADLVTEVHADLEAGRRVVVHCRGGVGRSGLVAAAVTATFGDGADAAIARVRRVQPNAVETGEQAAYVRGFVALRGAPGRPSGSA